MLQIQKNTNKKLQKKCLLMEIILTFLNVNMLMLEFLNDLRPT